MDCAKLALGTILGSEVGSPDYQGNSCKAEGDAAAHGALLKGASANLLPGAGYARRRAER
jgi:hypothetical protein